MNTRTPLDSRRGSHKPAEPRPSRNPAVIERRGSGTNSPPLRKTSASTRPSSRPSSRTHVISERRNERTTVSTTSVNVSRSGVKDDGSMMPPPPSRGSATESRPRKETANEMIWEPTVTLLPVASAPLGGRVSVPPLAGTLPPSQQPPPLDGMPLDQQEALILEDLLFVFMGCEGQYIRFDNYNPTVETDRLQGPNFAIASGLDPSLRDLTATLLKMATHYNAVEAFVEVHGKEEFGAVNHAMSSAIRNLLKDYLMLISQLEHQFLTSPSFTLHVLHLHTLPTQHLLSHLYSFAHELLKKNAMLQSDDDEEDSADDFDDVDNVIESLREGGAPALPGSKICKGGAVLGLLSQRMSAMAGDPAARTLFTMLLTEASKPYMKMLNEWVHKGMISDPHGEFLIKEAKGIRRDKLQTDYTDEYWDKRYTIRSDEIPRQLETVKEKILLAGKYLNVVRECGGVDVSQEIADVPQSFEDINFFDNINSAYAHANESLLSLLLTTHALPARLRSLKHYFFLDRADFFAYFLELSSTELSKPAKKVNVGKLQSLLDLALRQPGSIAASDPFKEDVTVEMNETSLTRWLMRVVSLTGVEEGATALDDTKQASSAPSEDDKNYLGYNALQLDYAVPFPLSLVISRKTILRYQLLFRYLLSLRHLEMQLSQSWHDNTKIFTWKHRSQHPELEMWKRRAWTLRARMLVFVQQLLYFCTNEVVEPNWNGLMKRLGEVKTVDQLMQDHVDFLDTCLKECMLTNAKLLKIHAKLTTTCSMWASYTRIHLTGRLIAADPTLADPRNPPANAAATAQDSTQDPKAKVTKLYENLERYEDNFNRHLKILLGALNFYAATETVVLLSLCARLQMAMGEEKGRELISGV